MRPNAAPFEIHVFVSSMVTGMVSRFVFAFCLVNFIEGVGKVRSARVASKVFSARTARCPWRKDDDQQAPVPIAEPWGIEPSLTPGWPSGGNLRDVL